MAIWVNMKIKTPFIGKNVLFRPQIALKQENTFSIAEMLKMVNLMSSH
jgi:hypothetical protein